jgi:hypothetical protein
MRFAGSVLLLGSLASCGDTHCPPIDDPIGPDFYGSSPGLCAGECFNHHMYRDGARVQLIVSEDDACQVEGTLSADLVAEVDELHAALLAGELTVGAPSCDYPDVGQTWIEFEESLTFAWQSGCAPQELLELDGRLSQAMWALAECRTTQDVEPANRCRPAY